jgi:hypothetical protein
MIVVATIRHRESVHLPDSDKVGDHVTCPLLLDFRAFTAAAGKNYPTKGMNTLCLGDLD